MFISRKKVNALRKTYKSGTKVQLDYMDDPFGLAEGTKGEVVMVDSAGQIHVRWETGSHLALIPGVDRFHIIKED